MISSVATFAAVFGLLTTRVSGHYIFQQLTHGGVTYSPFQYIRQNTNYNSPVTDLTSNDLRCNEGGETGGSTQTITVSAGDAFSFTSDTAVYHNGPLSIYMSKAPGSAASYDGSGQWFKILDLGPTFDASGTATWPLAQTYSYKIPPALPNGDYLLRIQQLGIHNPYPAGIPQFYIACAQITVVNGGSGSPGPLVSIPGFITGTESGYTVNIYNNFKEYTVPGPAVWAGQNSNSGGGATTTTATKPVTTTSTTLKTSVTPTSTPVAGTVPRYGQCGGQGWTGGTVCISPYVCTPNGAYYSQCL